MFSDREEELERLEAGLLEENGDAPGEDPGDDPDDLWDDPGDFGDETPQTYFNYANGYGKKLDRRVYNADRVDLDPEELSRAVQKKRFPGCLVFAVLALLALAAVFLWLAWRSGYLGG